jgi:hypothetical protein
MTGGSARARLSASPAPGSPKHSAIAGRGVRGAAAPPGSRSAPEGMMTSYAKRNLLHYIYREISQCLLVS